MKNSFHFHSRNVKTNSHLISKGKHSVLRYSPRAVRWLNSPTNASGVDTEASTSKEANSRQNMYNIVNDAIRSPEYDSGIGCPEDMSENLRAARENGSTVVLVQYLGLTAMAMIGGFAMHPLLIKLTAVTWGLEPSDSDFETSFFGLLSIVYSVFTGQTFLFLYERQMNIAQETYGEVFALELLVQQMFVSCQDPEYRALMAMSVRQYMIEEVYNPSDSESPFTCGGAYMNILGLLVAMQNQGVPVTGMVDACKQLADAQSRRAAVAAQILPVLHWVFLHGMEVIFVACFLIFDASNIDASVWSAPLTVPVERSLIFGALFGVLALNTLVLKDLDYPVSGLYAFRGSLDDRVSFLTSLLAELEKKPPDHVPSSVMALKQLGLISSPSAATDNGVSASPLDVPELARRARGRKMRTVPGLKWGQKVERW